MAQMQCEFTRAVEALEKQVTALRHHNTLLTVKLTQTKEEQNQWTVEASETIQQLQRELEIQAQEALEKQQQAMDQQEALSLEVAALKSLLQQETDYWTRSSQASRQDRDQLMTQFSQVQTENAQYLQENKTLQREIKVLQNRLDTAVATSKSFEQRLVLVVKEKQEYVETMELQLNRYRKKLHDKRMQKKYLTEALVRLQERESTREERVARTMDTTGAAEGVKSKGRTVDGQEKQRRVKKRELTLLDEMKAVTNGTMGTSKRIGSSRTGTSPTTSSPEISPRSARSAPYKRAPSVATTTPTASDGNSFNSSSSGSLRSMRSLRNVTGRRISSRSSSDSDNIDVSPRYNVAHRQGVNPTGRLERELSGLRRKLDSCMADTAARW
ncbi:unnamed protein product [Peronospora belbahrii]|nr:unnamed protein product [Peronospora belbahrii]